VKESQQWIFGETAERERSTHLARSGSHVVPTARMEKVVSSTDAPVILSAGGPIVSPDLLVIGEGRQRWEEIKAKTKPGWLKYERIYEHGMDYANFLQYARIQRETGYTLIVAIKEVLSPLDPGRGPERNLKPLGLWLIQTLAELSRRGHHEQKWPSNADQGRLGQGGWLWPRSCMAMIDPKREPGLAAKITNRVIETEEQLQDVSNKSRASRA